MAGICIGRQFYLWAVDVGEFGRGPF